MEVVSIERSTYEELLTNFNSFLTSSMIHPLSLQPQV